jgi:halocyanin-like protein
MVDTQPTIGRRGLLTGIGTAAVTALAGCAGGDGGGETTTTADGDAGTGDFGDWLADVSNYDGSVADRTGESEVTVSVGASGNDGNFAFDPAALRVSSGTTVVWEWTGEGNQHNVNAVEGASFESEQTDEEGHTYSRDLSTAGVIKYQCDPHITLGMKGVIEVVE